MRSGGEGPGGRWIRIDALCNRWPYTSELIVSVRRPADRSHVRRLLYIRAIHQPNQAAGGQINEVREKSLNVVSGRVPEGADPEQPRIRPGRLRAGAGAALRPNTRRSRFLAPSLSPLSLQLFPLSSLLLAFSLVFPLSLQLFPLSSLLVSLQLFPLSSLLVSLSRSSLSPLSLQLFPLSSLLVSLSRSSLSPLSLQLFPLSSLLVSLSHSSLSPLSLQLFPLSSLLVSLSRSSLSPLSLQLFPLSSLLVSRSLSPLRIRFLSCCGCTGKLRLC